MTAIFSASLLLTLAFSYVGVEVQSLRNIALLAAALAAVVLVSSFEAWGFEERRAAAPADDRQTATEPAE